MDGLGVRGDSIGGGWRLFVEMDSYAIAVPPSRLRMSVERSSNSMGLILEARSPTTFTESGLGSRDTLPQALIGRQLCRGAAGGWVELARFLRGRVFR